MKIYIPTRGRIHNQVTLGQLKQAVGNKITLVTAADQHKALKEANPGVDIEVLPKGVKGMPFIRQHILENSVDRYFCMIDDDLKFCTFDGVNDAGNRKMSAAEPKQLVKMFETLENWLRSGVAHCGITPRFLNWNRTEPYIQSTRMLHLLAYDKLTVTAKGCRFDKNVKDYRFSMEDFHMTLQLLRAGHPNRVSLDYCSDPAASNTEGGVSEFRTLTTQEANARFLAAQHPGFVKVKEKSTKSWKGLAEEAPVRYDVAVQWQKAFKSSQQGK